LLFLFNWLISFLGSSSCCPTNESNDAGDTKAALRKAEWSCVSHNASVEMCYAVCLTRFGKGKAPRIASNSWGLLITSFTYVDKVAIT